MKIRYLFFIVIFSLLAKVSGAQVFSAPGTATSAASPTFYPQGVGAAGIDFTGRQSISLPLVSLQSTNYTLPVSLTYDATGVKVNDLASWVGLKWNLLCGGSITRKVKGVPDENYNGRLGLKLRGFDLESHINAITTNNTTANALNLQELANADDYYDPITDTRGRLDNEPDIFSYNFKGHSGKFIINQDRVSVKLIPYDNILIYPICTIEVINSENSITLTGFEIIDDNGINYVFNIPEETTIRSFGWSATTLAEAYHVLSQGTSTYTSSWLPSKIRLPSTRSNTGIMVPKEILFTYTNDNYIIPEPASIWARGCPSSNCTTFDFIDTESPNAVVYPYTEITGKQLSAVEDDNSIINFIPASTVREDFTYNSALDKITVSRKFPTLKVLREFRFTYQYSVSGTLSYRSIIRDSDRDRELLWNQNDFNKRLMLKSIKEYAEDLTLQETIEENLYSFTYDESAPLPNRFSYQQDFWGYYNGNGANTVFPALYIFPNEAGNDRYSIYPKPGYSGLNFTLAGADRNPNPATIGLGALTKITNKFNGYTTYEYEPNDFYYDGANRLGCGLRIKKIITYDNVTASNTNKIVKEFTYKRSSDVAKSSGLLIDMPVFASIANTHALRSSSTPVSTINFTDPTQLSYYNTFLIRNYKPTYAAGSTDDLVLGYSEITEKSSDNSRTVFKYSLPGYYKQDLDNQLNVNCYADQDGYCDGLFKRYFSHYAANSTTAPDLTGYDFSANSILPFGPATNYDWNRGHLLEKKMYDADNFLIKENKYTYKLYYPGTNTAPDYVPAILINEVDNWKLDPNNNAVTNVMGSIYSPMYFFAKYELITNVAKVMETSTEKMYDKGHPGQYMQQTANYQYNGLNHTNPTKITQTDSRGATTGTEFLYSFDLLNPTNYPVGSYPYVYPQKGYQMLVSKHINVPIRKIDIIKPVGFSTDQVKSAMVYYFDDNLDDTHDEGITTVLPSEIKLLTSKNLIARSALTDAISSSGFVIDSRYKTEARFNKYDYLNNGNLLGYSDKTQKGATLWGYNNLLPVATVVNAEYDDVAYTSFEDDFKGGWTYDLSTDNYHIPPTGKLYHILDQTPISRSGMNSNKKYIVSYWSTNGAYPISGAGTVQQKEGITIGVWTYFEAVITGATSITISYAPIQGDNLIDELRLYPANAQMTTVTYDPLVGQTSECDVNNNIIYYEYDLLGRKKIIKDKRRNVLQTFEYGTIQTN